MKEKLLISKGCNRKLSPGGIATFNLPSRVTCGRACESCYAVKAERCYASARAKRWWNLAQAQRPDFVPRIVLELTEGHCKDIQLLRWHESGDVYSQTYLDKLTCVAGLVPGKTFYLYTKRLKDWDWSRFKAMENTITIDSLKYGPVNYGDEAQIGAWRAAGALVCPSTLGYGGKITCNHGCKLCCSRACKELVEARGVVFHKH